MSRVKSAIFSFLFLLGGLCTPGQTESSEPGSGAPTLRDAIQAQSSWENLQHLAEGTKCRVSLKNKDNRVTGSFQQWTPERLVLSDSKGRLVNCLRPEVLRTETLNPGSRKTRVIAVALPLFGIGMAIGYAMAPQMADDHTLSGGAGAFVGAIFGGTGAALAAIPTRLRGRPLSTG